MRWNQFRLTTTAEAEDIVSSMLMDLGIQGVQIEDKVPLTKEDKEQMFVDILPDIPEDDGKAYLTFYLESGEGRWKASERERHWSGYFSARCISARLHSEGALSLSVL